jgi:hypothetical protein
MATTKKKAKKKKSAPKPAKARGKRADKRVLTDTERLKLLKPRGEYDKIVEKIASELESGTLKVQGLSAAKLDRLLKVAEKARTRENALRTKQEKAMRRLSDARLIAEHDLWSAVLDVNANVKLAARKRPEVSSRFAFLTDALRGERAAGGPVADEDVAEEPAGNG